MRSHVASSPKLLRKKQAHTSTRMFVLFPQGFAVSGTHYSRTKLSLSALHLREVFYH